jgi:hypothetical protein
MAAASFSISGRILRQRKRARILLGGLYPALHHELASAQHENENLDHRHYQAQEARLGSSFSQ